MYFVTCFLPVFSKIFLDPDNLLSDILFEKLSVLANHQMYSVVQKIVMSQIHTHIDTLLVYKICCCECSAQRTEFQSFVHIQ